MTDHDNHSFELGRLAALTCTVGHVLLVDAARLAACTDNNGAKIVDAFRAVRARANRAALYVVAPSADPDAPLNDGLLAELVSQLGDVDVVHATEPIGALVVGALERDLISLVTIVTAGIDERYFDLWPLSRGVASVLDASTGVLHSCASIGEDLNADALPRAWAVVHGATRHSQATYLVDVARSLTEHGDLRGASIPSWLRDGAARKAPELDALTTRLRGDGRADNNARSRLLALVDEHRPATPQLGYVAADVLVESASRKLRSLAVLTRSGWLATSDEAEAEGVLRQLHAAQSDRWFGVRLLDLMSWMAMRGLPMPARAVDAAWSMFALDPFSLASRGRSKPPLDDGHARALRDFADIDPVMQSVPSSLRAWAADLRRTDVALHSLTAIAEHLPSLDAALQRRLAEHHLVDVVERDLGATLPVLARVEARGVRLAVPAGFSDGQSVQAELLDRHARATAAAAGVLGLDDAFDNDGLMVRRVELRFGRLPSNDLRGLNAAKRLERYIVRYGDRADGGDGLKAIEQRAALKATLQSKYIVPSLIANVAHVHSRTVPQATGRLGMRAPNLQGVAKHSAEGRLIRSALTAPAGQILLATDFNAFEVRVLAGLSRDPLLLGLCEEDDVHSALARHLFETSAPTREERERTKLAVHAMLFGQTREGFIRKAHALPRAEAGPLRDRLELVLGNALAYREAVHAEGRRDGAVTTAGGWRRVLRSSDAKRNRHAFSTKIQGTAADVFRRALRRLDAELPAGAAIAHHVHDEVYVQTPVELADQAESVLVHVMESAAFEPEPLLEPVRFVVKAPRRGTTWADLI